MAQHHHHHHHHRPILPHARKAQEDEYDPESVVILPFSSTEHWLARKPRSSLLRLLFVFLFLLFSFLLLFISDLTYGVVISPFPSAASPSANACSLSSPLCCDRSALRTDLCFLNGDIRTRSLSSSFLIFANSSSSEERIRPYTRKWEAPVMSTINELSLNLRPANLSATAPKCDVHHNVPAVVFSTGGYTGNVYHEFNDGLIPLYLTSRRFNRRVVFLILEYHDWWISKYANVISVLSDFPAIDFSTDN